MPAASKSFSCAKAVNPSETGNRSKQPLSAKMRAGFADRSKKAEGCSLNET